ncbi:MAG: ABC transporter ATP-binding protein [Chloroflexota bacterium]|nr:ABC transporter ATP-binding protein [Chloroflexota bacterium]
MGEIVVDSVTKRFGDHTAVDCLSFTIPDAHFVSLLGPSGCGKTTTLNMIAGLEELTDGHISIDNSRVDDLPPHKRDLAFVFQDYALYPHKTVRDNLGFGLKMRGTPKGDIAGRVEGTARSLGIEHLLDRKPRELSGGQRQRVALGRAIVRRPEVFLFDEPLSNLDALLRDQTRSELKRLHQELGTTSVYVTHDQEEALTLSDEIAVMRDGRLEQFGTPEEIYRRPATEFVASFVGKPRMNLLDADRREPGLLTISGSGLTVGVDFDVPEHVRVGVRAEDVQFACKPNDGARILATVRLVEPIGAATDLTVAAGSATLKVRTKAFEEHKIGDEVWIGLGGSNLHFFDLRSGVRLEAKKPMPLSQE